MNRKNFLRNLIALPLIGGTILESTKSMPIKAKKIMRSSFIIPNELHNELNVEGSLYDVKEGSGKGLWCYMGGSWRLMATSKFSEEKCEPKLSLTDRRA